MRIKRIEAAGVTRFDRKVVIDLDSIGPGVIAFAGDNGAGKTSLMEIAGPAILFREMPTRDPSKLGASTRPGGGWMQVDFQLGVDDYRAKIEVNKSGTEAAYLWRNGQPVVSGKVREYDAEIERLIGTPQAYYASVFGLQGGGGKLASLTVGDRKAIFRYFLGLDRIEEARVTAQARMTKLSAIDLDRLTNRVQEATAEVARIEADIADRKSSLAGWVKADAQAQAARTAASGAIAKWEQRQAAVAKAADLTRRLEADTATAKRALEQRDAVIATQPADPGPEPTGLDAARKAMTDAQAAMGEIQRLQAAVQDAQRAVDVAGADQTRIGRQIDDSKRRSGLLGQVPCHGAGEFAGCPLITDAVQAKTNLAQLEQDLAAAQQQSADLTAAHAVAVDALAKARATAPDLRALQAEVSRIEQAVAAWHRAQTAVTAHAGKVDAAKQAFEAAKDRVLALRAQVKALPPIPDADPVDVAALDQEVNHARQGLADVQAQQSRDVGRLDQARTQVVRAQADLDAARGDAADLPALQFLTRALGANGIQALEIAAAGPTIAAMANDLLLSCFGPRFTIEVQTQRETTTKGGVAEDLEIVVLDAQQNRKGPLGSLSGGEQVIVDEAVRTALAMFAARRLETPIQTLYRDETSGALQPENARRYVQMLRRAAEIGGFHQILFVAHDPDVINSADAVVRVSDGEVAVQLL